MIHGTVLLKGLNIVLNKSTRLQTIEVISYSVYTLMQTIRGDN
jgi:hypothetical protein